MRSPGGVAVQRFLAKPGAAGQGCGTSPGFGTFDLRRLNGDTCGSQLATLSCTLIVVNNEGKTNIQDGPNDTATHPRILEGILRVMTADYGLG